MQSQLSDANTTDLLFYGRFGKVRDHGSYVLVRSPDEPTSYLGNQLIVRGDVAAEHVQSWIRTFAAEFTDRASVRHITLNVEGEVDPEWHRQQLRDPLHYVENLVLSLSHPFPEPHANSDFAIEEVESDNIWEAVCAGQLEENAATGASARAYFTKHFRRQRTLVEEGRALWLAALWRGSVVGSLGLLHHGNLLRFQAIRTVPSFRRKGIASHLMSRVLQIARHRFGATRALLVTSHRHSAALSLYERLGFTTSGTQAFLRTW